MDVAYDSRKLEKVCTDERTMQKERGDIAKRLKLRINALETASCVVQLRRIDPQGHWHMLHGDLAGRMAGSASRNYRLIIRLESQEKLNKDFDYLECSTVTVMEIEDYH